MLIKFQLLLILFMFVGGVSFGESTDEVQARAKIELLGGKAWRDMKQPGRPVIEVDFEKSERFNEKYLHLLNAFPKLSSLNLVNKTITETGWNQISELKSLTELWVYEGQISEEAARKLKESLPEMKLNVVEGSAFGVESESVQPNLAMFVIPGPIRSPPESEKITRVINGNITEIDFTGTAIKDDDLKELRKIENLTTLNLAGTAISDDGLIYLTEVKKVRRLLLARTRITDAGIKEFNELADLRKLDLSQTEITDDGLKEISKVKTLLDT